jgi:hypothetical protein
MNAPQTVFVSKFFATPLGRVAACVGLAALLSGCANPFATAKVDPNSVIADKVTASAKIKGDFPKFSDIPPAPKDVRAAPAWGKAADQIAVQGADLDQKTADSTWSLGGTDTFASHAQSLAGNETVDDASATAATEAFARQIRQRATPPPPPKR